MVCGTGNLYLCELERCKVQQRCKKEITQMNELLLEQNTQLRKQNDHLNMVILSVCSKSVRDRQQKKDGKTNDETEKEKQ